MAVTFRLLLSPVGTLECRDLVSASGYGLFGVPCNREQAMIKLTESLAFDHCCWAVSQPEYVFDKTLTTKIWLVDHTRISLGRRPTVHWCIWAEIRLG